MNERAWLVLGHAHVRVTELRALLDLFGSVADVVAQPRARLAESGLADEKCNAIVSPDDAAVSAALRWLEEDGHHLVAWGEHLGVVILAPCNEVVAVLFQPA